MPSLNWLGILLLICSALGLSSSFVVLEDNVSGQVALANDNSPGPLFRSTYVIGNPRDGYECIDCDGEAKVDKNGKVTLNGKVADKEEKPQDYTDSLDEVADPVSKEEKDKVAVGPSSIDAFGETEVSQALAVSESYHFFDQTVAPSTLTGDYSEEIGNQMFDDRLAKEVALMDAKNRQEGRLDALRARIDQTLTVARDQLSLRLFLGTLKANMSEAQVRATSRHWLELKNTIVNKDFQWLLDRAFDLVITSARQSAVHQFLVATRNQQQQQQLEPWTSLAFWVQYLVSLIVAGCIGALSADRRRLRVYYRRMMMTEAPESTTSSSVEASKAEVASLPPVYTPAAVGADNKAFVA